MGSGDFVAIGVIWFLTGGPSRPLGQNGLFLKPPTYLGVTGSNLSPASRNSGSVNSPSNLAISNPNSASSTWYGLVDIGLGNARSEYQPGSEYITLNARYNRSALPINLSGWILENGKGNRYFISARNTPVRGMSERAVIPQATRLIASRDQIAPYGPVMLESGARVVVVSGKPPSYGETRKVSGWLENRCSGYWQDNNNSSYNYPALSLSCPRVDSTPGFEQLDDDCRQLVRSRVRTCQVPEFGENREGDTTLNGSVVMVKSYCRKYIETHFNYPTCVADHLNGADFFGKNWQVYLGRTWEMWSEQRDTITLYDQFGKMVDQISYGQ